MKITFANPDNQPRTMTREQTMEHAIRHILATARKVDAGSWHVSSDTMKRLEEAVR